MGNVILKNIKKKYGATTVVENLNLEVIDGEFIVLVGPSGCGKSTTLRMIAGLEDISEGTLMIGDKEVNDLPPHKRKIAMVFQNYALYPHKTVKDNIIFGLKKEKAPPELIKSRLEKVTDILQLEPYLDRKPADLSGGQRQRVAMGRALVRDPEVFLFDEPLSNLDAKLRHHMRTEIAKIHQQYKTTSIYVTHDQIEAMTLGDRVVVMRDGFIEQLGTPMEIYLNPNNTFIATFIGSPSMNLIPGRVEGDTISLGAYSIEKSRLNIKSKLDDKQAILIGIRPDFFEDTSFVQASENQASFDNISIELIELLGFDQEIIFTLDETTIKARLDLRSQKKAGEKINLTVDYGRILCFDEKSEKRIR
jgi:multiple sugar transport system ATP-binding protein